MEGQLGNSDPSAGPEDERDPSSGLWLAGFKVRALSFVWLCSASVIGLCVNAFGAGCGGVRAPLIRAGGSGCWRDGCLVVAGGMVPWRG